MWENKLGRKEGLSWSIISGQESTDSLGSWSSSVQTRELWTMFHSQARHWKWKCGLDRATFSPSGVFLLCLQLMKSLPYGLSENTRQLGMGHCQRCAFCLIKHSGLTKTVWVPCQVNHRQQGVFSRPCRAALFVLCAVYIPHLFKYIQSGTL